MRLRRNIESSTCLEHYVVSLCCYCNITVVVVHHVFFWNSFGKIYMFMSLAFPLAVFRYLFQNKMFVLFKVWDFLINHLLFAVMRPLTRNFNILQPLRSKAFEIWTLELPPPGPKYRHSLGGNRALKDCVDRCIRDLMEFVFTCKLMTCRFFLTPSKMCG